jgi:hypothetical protein
MAIAAVTEWELRITGHADNGGCFRSDIAGGTDFSQQDSPVETYKKTLATSGALSTTLTRGSGSWATTAAGNCIYITGGTNFAVGFYQIVLWVSSSSVVLDRTPTPVGAGSAGDGRLGGAQSDPIRLTAALVAGNRVWCKAGTHTMAGAWQLPQSIGTHKDKIRWTGYHFIRGDGVYPAAIFDGNGASRDVMEVGTSAALYGQYIFEFLGWKGAGGSYPAVDANCRNNIFWRCGTYDTNSSGFSLAAFGNVAIGCEAYNFGIGGTTSYGIQLYNNSAAIGCYAHSPVARVCTGFLAYYGATLTRCVARNVYRGFYFSTSSAAYQGFLINCAAYGCATDGIYIAGNVGMLNLINCLGVNNLGFGINDANSTGGTVNVSNFAHYGNGSGGIDTGGPSNMISLGGLSEIALAEQPFMNPAGHDFRIKSHMTELLRTGFPENVLAEGVIADLPYGLDYGPAESPWRGRRT